MREAEVFSLALTMRHNKTTQEHTMTNAEYVTNHDKTERDIEYIVSHEAWYWNAVQTADRAAEIYVKTPNYELPIRWGITGIMHIALYSDNMAAIEELHDFLMKLQRKSSPCVQSKEVIKMLEELGAKDVTPREKPHSHKTVGERYADTLDSLIDNTEDDALGKVLAPIRDYLKGPDDAESFRQTRAWANTRGNTHTEAD